MGVDDWRRQLEEVRQTTSELQAELAETDKGLIALILELEQRVDEHAAELNQQRQLAERRADELATLNTIVAAVNESPDLRNVLSTALEQIVIHTGVDGAECHLVDDADVLILAATWELDEAFVAASHDLRFLPNEGIPGRAFASRRPIYVADAPFDDRYLRRDLARAAGYHSLLCVPIHRRGTPLGTFMLYSRQPRQFTSETQALLVTVGRQLAMAIERARLYEAERRRTAELACSNALITALGQVAARIETTPEPDLIMDTLGAELKRLDVTCFIALLEPDTGELTIRYASIESKALAQAEKLAGLRARGFRLSRQRFPIYADLIEHKKAVFVPDAMTLAAAMLPGLPKPAVERVLQLAGAAANTTLICLPLTVEEQVLGILMMWNQALGEDDIPALSIFAGQVAAALEVARLHEQLKTQRVAEQETLLRLSQRLVGLADPPAVMDTAAQAVQQALQVEIVSLMTPDPSGQRLLLVGGAGWEPEQYGRYQLDIANSREGHVFRSGEPFRQADVQAGKPFPCPAALKEHNVLSSLTAPLHGKGGVLGTLCAHSKRRRQFSPGEVRLLSLIANQTAQALERARLFATEQRRAQEAETLRQAGAIVAATLQQDEAIERILQQLERVVPYDSASVQLLRGGYLEIVGGRGWSEPAAVVGLRFPVPGDNPNTVVIQQRWPHILGDAPAAYALFGDSPHSHIQSWLGAPLVVQDQVIGMLAVDSAQPDYFSPDHTRLVNAFADQVAVAIENARLYSEAERRAMELSTVLEAARAVSSTRDLEEVLALIAGQMTRAIGVSGCTLSQWDRGKNAIVTWVEWRKPGSGSVDEPGAAYALDDFPATRAVLENRQPLVVLASDPDADPAEAAHMRGVGTLSLLMLPLAAGERVIGLVELDECERERAFSDAEIRLCQALADQAAVAIENARLFTELAESGERYRTLVEQASDGIFITDSQGNYIDVNSSGCQMLGYSRQEILDMHITDLVPAEDLEIAPLRLEELRAGKILLSERRLKCKDGSLLDVEISAKMLPGDRLQGIARDITERKRAAEAVKQTEQRYRDLFEEAPVLYVITRNQDGVPFITDCNQLFMSTLGYTRAEVLGRPSTDFYAPESGAKMLAGGGYQRALEGRFSVEERELLTRDGRVVNTLLRAAPATDPDGQVTGTQALYIDVTERMQAEETLAKLSRAVQQSADIVYITDRAGIIEYVNPAFEALTGYTRAEAIGKTPRLFKSGQHDDPFYQTLWGTILSGRVYREVMINKKKDGELYYEEKTITPLRDRQGNITHFVNTGKNITGRIRHEREREALLAVASALRVAQTRAEMLPVVLDQLLVLLKAKGATFAMRDPVTGEIVVELGRGTGSDLTGLRTLPGEGISGRVIATGRSYVNSDLRTDPQTFQSGLGREPPAAVCVPLIAEKQTVGALWVGRETAITEEEVRLLAAVGDMAANAIHRATLHEQVLRHAAELEQRVAERTQELAAANEQLKELDRLKSKFVSDVSHELRTPVTNLKLHLDLLEHGRPENRNRYVEVLKVQADRLGQLIEDILDLSRLEIGRKRVKFAPLSLNEVVEQVVTAHLPRAAAAGLELAFVPDTGLPLIPGARNQLAQVVTNLVANAINYTPAGAIRISTHLAAERGQVCLRVQDTGIGIKPEDRPHLFERFYRGDHNGHKNIPGSGLGLAIVEEIVDVHSGRIEVESEVDGGTTFRVWLPLQVT